MMEDLRESYQAGEDRNEVLGGIGLTPERGQIGVILGPSGSGKSMLMNIIGDADHTDNGGAYVDSLEVTSLDSDRLTDYRRDSVGFTFQSYNLVSNLTAMESIKVASNISKASLDMNTVLSAVELELKRKSFPRELSGGEQQCVATACAVVRDPKPLLCDEPTSAPDYETAHGVLSLLQQINHNLGTTVLVITHNIVTDNMANMVYKLRGGKIVETARYEETAPAKRIEW